MPCFRGLELSVFAQPASQPLPEFPHPDGSSVRLLSLVNPPPSPQGSKARSLGSEDMDTRRVQKANPCISVYIPSAPGSQFWIHYSVKRAPEPQCQLYFKLSMNGRSTTSWGINPAVQHSGSIKRALYEPCDRWHYKEGGTSVAEDGGLIEVQVFRATGRKRRAPVLPEHRSQESYGIASPSGGLIECPEEAFYFDWSLIDPKDSPYAVFRFHYRSWANLLQLSLVPRPEEDNGISAIPTWENTRLQAKENTLRFGVLDETEGNPPFLDQNTTPANATGPAMTPKPINAELILQGTKPKGFGINGKPPLNDLRQRPLPDIPIPRLATRKSYESCAPSITPSLLTYAESNEADDFEIGMATRVPIRVDPIRP